MTRRVVVIGAGMGGLTAALRLARSGYRVQVIEARDGPGGLAAGFDLGGFTFDAGPYVLLDRRGLDWAFNAVGLDLAQTVTLRALGQVYEVSREGGPTVGIRADLQETADGLERSWPGSGRRYARLVSRLGRIYDRLEPLLYVSRPGLGDVLRSGAWREIPFLMRSLGSVLMGAGLPAPVADALSIWTHVAGQETVTAPSLLALVPALIHRWGAFYPSGGVGAVARALAEAAERAGIEFRFRTRVRRIRLLQGRVAGVEVEGGDDLPADAVISNASAVGTYLDLIGTTPPREKARLSALPLQSPGVCAYMAVRGRPAPPYLRFRIPPNGGPCRLLVAPGAAEPSEGREGWWPARLIAPMDHGRAERSSPAEQRDYLERLLEEVWWREDSTEVRVLGTRTPAEWGEEYHLYRRSMNPVMTARLARAGRIAHRSTLAGGLYLAGGSTHPGQWVSFCAISGVLAADCLREDLA